MKLRAMSVLDKLKSSLVFTKKKKKKSSLVDGTAQSTKCSPFICTLTIKIGSSRVQIREGNFP
jgi:hypothetical protein